ncbi:MAG: DUF853 family protein [Caldisericaceae bacterium]|nr:DUF853 family protein [Caldisericaceae bacterium]
MDTKKDLYIGKTVDPKSGKLKDKFFYKTKHLSTHEVIVGMTGSGKTGMAIVTLEEAILDGIPVLAIDPKGDLTNLLLTFPSLSAEEFKPWIDKDEAERKGMSVDMYAEAVAEKWRKGLASWDIGPDRLQKLKNAADYRIFTPGSTSGIPVSVLQGFKKPEGDLDEEEIGEKVKGITTAILGLIGIHADPIKSREHILISTIISTAWAKGENITIEDLIMRIQKPPFKKLGVFPVDSFFPKKDRLELAMQINALIASPSFQTWLGGAPLNIDYFIKSGDKPGVSVFYIAHLSESERMFFVTLFLQELLSWMRMQPGTDMPQVILYFDEIFGYFPPYPKDPPSKHALLTLMKQARAFGVSVILATQNPVDIDYKGLTNAGTWLIGKLQQENDKDRVLSGLEGTLQENGSALDRKYFDKILGTLKPRTFLLHDVHADKPVLINSRWAMNYLRGPLTKLQIEKLMADKKSEAVSKEPVAETKSKKQYLPDFPEDVPVLFEKNHGEGPYIPYVYGEVESLYQNDKANLYLEKTFRLAAKAGDSILEIENVIEELDKSPVADSTVPKNATFGNIPNYLLKKQSYSKIKNIFKQYVKGNEIKLFYSPFFKEYSKNGESKEDFVNRLNERLKEVMEDKLEKIKEKYEDKIERAEEKLQTAKNRLADAEAALRAITQQTGIDIGAGVLSALMGRSIRGSISRAARTTTRRKRAQLKIDKAKEDVEKAEKKIEELKAELEEKLKEKEDELREKAARITEKAVRPKASSVVVKYVGVLFR